MSYSSNTMTYRKQLPSVPNLANFLQSIFPVRSGDTQFYYHSPRRATSSEFSHVVLSVTPTPGLYTAISNSPCQSPLTFLHRPWKLDRKHLPSGATVLSSHKGFDEVLTVGANTALASSLGIALKDSIVIQGYKGSPDRTIGIVGPLVSPVPRRDLLDSIATEFVTTEGHFGFDQPRGDAGDKPITTVAIMNAFHPDEVDRVVAAAQAIGTVSAVPVSSGILYLTGAVREQGLQAALAREMAVVCVGHRACEEWGIRHLAKILTNEWPLLHVDVILEEETEVKASHPLAAH
ncbi:hypothetical protein F5Y16DRAFT_131756 [Xylariaceae sp. FL0255]|nr:hypothetical protein F5Y16DRAFT_131756 [Xylariaceae sp. FL0255]